MMKIVLWVTLLATARLAAVELILQLPEDRDGFKAGFYKADSGWHYVSPQKIQQRHEKNSTIPSDVAAWENNYLWWRSGTLHRMIVSVPPKLMELTVKDPYYRDFILTPRARYFTHYHDDEKSVRLYGDFRDGGLINYGPVGGGVEACHEDGKIVFCSFSGSAGKNEIAADIWLLNGARAERILEGGKAGVQFIHSGRYSPKDKSIYFYSGSLKGPPKILRFQTGKKRLSEIRTLPPISMADKVELSDDGRTLAWAVRTGYNVSYQPASLYLYDIPTGKIKEVQIFSEIKELTGRFGKYLGHLGVGNFIFTPDSRELVYQLAKPESCEGSSFNEGGVLTGVFCSYQIIRYRLADGKKTVAKLPPLPWFRFLFWTSRFSAS